MLGQLAQQVRVCLALPVSPGQPERVVQQGLLVQPVYPEIRELPAQALQVQPAQLVHRG